MLKLIKSLEKYDFYKITILRFLRAIISIFFSKIQSTFAYKLRSKKFFVSKSCYQHLLLQDQFLKNLGLVWNFWSWIGAIDLMLRVEVRRTIRITLFGSFKASIVPTKSNCASRLRDNCQKFYPLASCNLDPFFVLASWFLLDDLWSSYQFFVLVC